MCCELCKPNTTERKFGLDNCRMPLCSCHTTPPSGERSWNLETEYTERFTILYANYSGREDESRATFRIDARILLRNYLSSRLTEIEGKIEKAKRYKEGDKVIINDVCFDDGLDTALQIIKEARER